MEGEMKHGYGKMIYANGEKYDGEFFENKRSGYGVLKFSNGETYTGSFQNDNMHGLGTFSCDTEKL